MKNIDDQPEITSFPRSLVKSGAVIAAVMAIAIFITRWLGSTGPTAIRVESLAGSLAFAVLLAGPAFLALRSLRIGQRGPLLPALVLVLIVTFTSFSVFFFGGLLVAIVWGQAFARWPTAPSSGRVRVAGATLGATVLGIASMAALFVHVDPYCWEQIGTQPAEFVASESESGFAWDLDAATRTTGARTVDPQGATPVQSGCSSDRIVWLQALGSGLAGLAALGVGTSASRRAAVPGSGNEATDPS